MLYYTVVDTLIHSPAFLVVKVPRWFRSVNITFNRYTKCNLTWLLDWTVINPFGFKVYSPVPRVLRLVWHILFWMFLFVFFFARTGSPRYSDCLCRPSPAKPHELRCVSQRKCLNRCAESGCKPVGPKHIQYLVCFPWKSSNNTSRALCEHTVTHSPLTSATYHLADGHEHFQWVFCF